MRRHGNLTRWNDERGFGFVLPAGTETEVFVHISAFPRGSSRPIVGELLSFDIEKGPDGRDRAVNLYRAGQRPAPGRGQPSAQPQRRSLASIVSLGLVLLIAGIWAMTAWRGAEPTAPPALTLAKPVPPPTFQCDGRTRCPQMRSCAEATYFIQNCPDTKMDGDGDGVPCESQHCGL